MNQTLKNGNEVRQWLEIRLQQECFKWLWNTHPETRRLFYANHNNPKNKIEGAILRTIGLTAGVADTTFLHNGKVYFLEFKTKTGVQSDAQKEWQRVVVNAGFFYSIIRDLEQFKTVINETIGNKGRV